MNHRIIITQTAKGGGTAIKFDAMVLIAPCTSLAWYLRRNVYETFNFAKVVWNRSAGSLDDAEFIVRRYGPGAGTQSVAHG
jgi:hypothetical protein